MKPIVPAEGAAEPPWVAIIDDDSSVRMSLARLLRSEGIRVGAFATGDEYLEACISDGAPACLVLDVYLGGASGTCGFEFHDQLTAAGSSPPVIMITAHDDVSSDELARHSGATGYLRKPFGGDELLGLVRRAVDARGA